MSRITEAVNFVDVEVTNGTDVRKLPWGLIGAAAILALFGIAFWRTTVGKIVIIIAIVLGFLSMMGMLQAPPRG